MAISIKQEWGMQIFNANGSNVLADNLFYPKYIGKMVVRQRELGDLVIVGANGNELAADDMSVGVSLNELRGRAADSADSAPDNAHRPFRDYYGDTHCGVSYRYEFMPYGGGFNDQAALLPALIHGWGTVRDEQKLQMARYLVASCISGEDLKALDFWNKQRFGAWSGYGDLGYAPARFLDSGVDIRQGLPFTCSFRCKPLNPSVPDSGFGLVQFWGGALQLEMTRHTEMTVYFYDMAGVPFDYFVKCSTVAQPAGWGVVCYSRRPKTLKYVLPIHDNTAARGRENTALETGLMSAFEYVYRDPDGYDGTVSGLADMVKNTGGDVRVKNALCAFFGEDRDYGLRYEQYNSGRRFLKLTGNMGRQTAGRQIKFKQSFNLASARGISRQMRFSVYEVKCGHDYAGIASLPVHASIPYGTSATPLGAGLFGPNHHSVFDPFVANNLTDLKVLPQHLQDFQGAPWNKTVEVPKQIFEGFVKFHGQALARKFTEQFPDGIKQTGFFGTEKEAAFSVLLRRLAEMPPLEYAAWADKQFDNPLAKIRHMLGVPEKIEIGNPLYNPETAAAHSAAFKSWVRDEGFKELVAEGIKAAESHLQDDPQLSGAFEKWKAMWQLVDSVMNDSAANMNEALPFFSHCAYRHSDDKLELAMVYASQQQLDSVAKIPDKVPADWLFCRKPD